MIRISLIACFALSACGGGGGGSFPGGSGGVSADFQEYNRLLTDFYLAAGSGYTSPGSLPTTASYSGIATLGQGTFNASAYLGDLSLDVEFAGGSVSGSIDGFSEVPVGSVSGTPVSGNFTIFGSSTGNNSPSSPAFTGFASGSLDGTSDLIAMEGYVAGSGGRNGQILFTGSPWVGFGYVERD